MQLLRRYPAFRRLWAAQLVSLTGDWLSFVAVSLLALDQGEGALALALVLAAHSLPRALMAPLAGVVTDRMDRVRLLMGSRLVQALLTVGMALAAWFDQLALVQLVLLARTAAGAFATPAEGAALPRLVSRADLVRANALSSATWSAAFALGMALGGVVAMAGAVVALLVDAGTFVIAALLVWPLPPMVPRRDESSPDTGALLSVVRDLRATMHRVVVDRPLRAAVLAKAPLSLAGGSAWVLLNLVAADPHFVMAGSVGLGLLHAIRGIGSGVGPLLASRLVDAGANGLRTRHGAAWLLFGAVALFSLQLHWLATLVAALLWGVGMGANWVLSTADIQRHACDEILGRVSALDGLLVTLSMSLGALLGALAVDLSATPPVAGWLGVGLGIAAWLAARVVAQLDRSVSTRSSAVAGAVGPA